MKKIYLLFFSVLFTAQLFAQINLTATGGTPAASYSTLKAAFDQINAGTHTGAISIAITANSTETASAVLNAKDSGAANYTSIIISPSGGASRTISGDIAGHLIDLNGADNVTIDGLNAGGNSLTISNISGQTGASTIRFTSDASNNTITKCSVLGSTGSALSSGFGVIYFGTGSVTGNDNNTISNNNIGPAGTNLPINGIYSFGTSTAIDNSGISITNNAIYDYFNANGASNGINANTANSTWTISGNSFYQTATRTYLTANTHNVITITSGSGYIITNNFIGGSAANAGGTAYAMAGTIASRFVAINVSAGTTTTVNSIQGNTIANITLNTSSGATTVNGIICGINVTSGNFNIGNVTGNTIGATTGVDNIRATSTTTGGLVVGINSSSTGTIAIQNNTIGSLTSSGITATIAGSVTGINVSGVAAAMTISGNTIGNTTTDNIRGGTLGLTTGNALVAGINLPSTPSTITISGNTIRNLASYGTGTSGFVRGIMTAAAAGNAATYSITQNTISNIVTNAANTSIANGNTAVTGIQVGIGTNNVISQNIIHSLANINTTTTGSYVAGIAHGNATNSTISRNRIYNLTNEGTSITATAPSVVVGIVVRSGTTAVTIHNNMISLGVGQTTNTAFLGIQANNGSTPDPTSKIYYNSIHIEGTVAAGAQPSFGIARTDFSATARTAPVEILNNIINNNRSGGTGSHYAIANNFGATTATATGWGANAANYNVLNANASTTGFWTSAQNFAGWKLASNGDNNSLSGITTTFVNTTSGDLHLNLGVTPTQLESGGTAVSGITIDFDNDVRPGPAGSVNGGGTLPDIGADEFDGVYLDLVPPTISYTPLIFTCTGGNRTLVATITDGSGVPTSGLGLPRLFWKINAGAYTAVTGTSLGGGQYQFSFGAGAVLGDVVSYYIVAQDNAGTPNVGSFPSVGASGFASNPPNATTPPTTPSSYTISPVLNGTYTVGAAGNYTSLTAAITAYNNSCLGGPVVFNLIDAAYTTTSDTIRTNPDASATNTLTIKPTLSNTTITGNTSTATLVLLGADYITIDGDIGSTANTICPPSTATRNLTISNSNASTASAVIWITADGANGANNNTIKSCNISGNAPTTTGLAMGIGGATIGTGSTSALNNNNSFINNNISKAQVGIYTAGISNSIKNEGTTINQNLLNTAAPNNIGRGGIMAFFENNMTVNGNNISKIINTTSTDTWAISLGLNAFSTSSTAGAECSNVTISNNIIDSIRQTNTFSAIGIFLSPGTTGTSEISNNMISGVAANGTAGDFSCGIFILPTAGSTTKVYHNTVAMTGTLTSGTEESYALAVSGGTLPTLDIRNNIFVNTQNNGTGLNYAIGLTYTAFTNITCDNNNLFTSTGALYSLGATASIATPTNQTTLAAWQTATGKDAASKNIVPVFVSTSDLHLSNAAGVNCVLDGFAVPVSVTNDIDCGTRDAAAPDMGADEFTAVAAATLAATTGGAQVCTNAVVSAAGTQYKDSICNVVARILPNGASPVTGSINSCVTIDGSVQLYGGRAYVQRHFDFTPSVNPATATARITLYVLQSEFTTYNSNNGTEPDLMTGPSDMSGISNLRITQYSGTGTAPGNYTGTATLIDPIDGDIVWNSVQGWWEISFNVTGFSGFYIHSGTGVLPVTIVSLSAYKEGRNNQLIWTTATEQSNRGFEIQKSKDGINYTSIGFVNSRANSGNSNVQLKYQFTDVNVSGTKQFYRLLQVDVDGRGKLSNTVIVKGDKPNETVLDGLFPNPAASVVNVLVATPNRTSITLLVTDVTGKVLSRKQVTAETGTNTIPVEISRLQSGAYLVKMICSSGCESAPLKFIKQ